MNLGRLLVFACVVAFGMSPALAQQPNFRGLGTGNGERLQIEIARDGSVVAKPELRGASGRELHLDLNGEWAQLPALKGLRERISITPTVRGNDIALAFDITSGDRQLRPSLVISKDVRGSVEWAAADGQPIRLTIGWAP